MDNKFLKYDTDNLQISQVVWEKSVVAKSESMMALGNGYLGLRSVDEERTSYNKEDLFVNGVFNKENADEVDELANLADSIQTPIFIDGEEFSLVKKDKYTKVLDIKIGTLLRTVELERNGKTFEFKFERFVSQFNKHLYAQRITILQTSGDAATILVKPAINGQTTNYGAQHMIEGDKRRITLEAVKYIEKTSISNRIVAHNLVLKASNAGEELKGGTDDFVLAMDRRRVGFNIKVELVLNKPFVLEKLMSVNTSIENDKGDLTEQAVLNISENLQKELLWTTYDNEETRSETSWKDIWNSFHVEIKGDSNDAKYDRLASAFGIFHMNSFVPKSNSNISIGAKGLSGEGYQGHSFWDTEFFVLPNYFFTDTKIARNLLEYRYKGIKGARAKAYEEKVRPEESKLEGAQYPWEMAWPTDGEVCPYWGQADVETGVQEPIASRRQEIHVSADVAYAVHQYFDFTGDQEFMDKMGYEMIIDTAIFWAHRAEKNADGTYEIKDVMGPNEYKGNIDNNAYINAFAKVNLELALHYLRKLSSTEKGKVTLQNVYSKIPYGIPMEKLIAVSENLVQQLPNKDGIIAENDQFLGLERLDNTMFQLLGDAGKKLFNTKEGHIRLEGQIVKQADVTLLTFLLPQLFDKDIILKNFDFYEPITTHDSSLSPTTYALQAIDLRKMDLAYKLYKYSLNIDLGTNMHSCDKGIHAGALAAIWQTNVFGYGGLRWIDKTVHINPKLPEAWEGLEYKVSYQGADLLVSVSKDKFRVETTNKKEVEIYINNKKEMITAKAREFEVQNEL